MLAEPASAAAEPSADELVARARELVPRLRERAERCERERRVPEESIRELKQAGLFRILQPRAFGGHELDFATYVRVSIELGRGCASTAWVYENNAMHQLILALFPAETQKELWGSGDPVRRDRPTARPPGPRHRRPSFDSRGWRGRLIAAGRRGAKIGGMQGMPDSVGNERARPTQRGARPCRSA